MVKFAASNRWVITGPMESELIDKIPLWQVATVEMRNIGVSRPPVQVNQVQVNPVQVNQVP